MDQFLSSGFGLKLGLSLARNTPPWLGYAIGRVVARWIGTARNSDLLSAARLNQWVASGEVLDRDHLNTAVLAHFQHQARSIYDLYHNFQDLAAASRLFKFAPNFQNLVKRPKFDQRGLVVAGLHMSGFDLALRWLCPDQMDPLSLTIPNPEGGRRMEFQMRARSGLNLVPGSVEGLRQGLRYLKRGGIGSNGYRPPPREPSPPQILRASCFSANPPHLPGSESKSPCYCGCQPA